MEELTKRLNITKLLQDDKYLIPLYQRNYAWGRDEMHQLLNDINDTTGNYYLGTLVVSKKNDFGYDEFYEIIDGQQRHTALSIINTVFKNKGYKEAIPSRKLFFEAREKSENVLDELLKDKNSYQKVKNYSTTDYGIYNIIKAVQDVEDFLFEKLKDQVSESKYVERFYKDVIIFRAELPLGTDLNHYFEVMNNRGEQLEKHEILKAAFMANIKDEEKFVQEIQQNVFAMIWDACSQMNAHIQMNFSANVRKEIFGEQLQEIPGLKSLQEFINKKVQEQRKVEKEKLETNSKLIKQAIENDIDSNLREEENDDIISIIRHHKVPVDFDQNKKENFIEKFSSIIDFPNFLLQVFNLQKEKVSLDDKFLLDQFGYPNNLPVALDFVSDLLKYRVLFDRYVIKREGDTSEWSWSMKKVVVKNEDFEYQATYNEEDLRRKNRMIQSMLHVTFPSNSYKNWLLELMKFFKETNSSYIQGEDLLHQIENQGINYYNNNISHESFNAGLGTPRFLFNYLDYLLWIKYYDEIRGGANILSVEENASYKGKINAERDKFSKFRFVQRSSIEHLFPQSRVNEIDANNEKEKQDVLDSFGNLCLISRSSNSAYNNDLPSQKRHDSKSKNESLKQLIMFSSFDGENWNKEQINQHHKEMNELLVKSTSKTQ